MMCTRTLFVETRPLGRDCIWAMMERVSVTVTRGGSDTKRNVTRSSLRLSVVEKMRSSD